MRRRNAYLLLCLGVVVPGCSGGRISSASPETPTASESTLAETTMGAPAPAAEADARAGDLGGDATAPASATDADVAETGGAAELGVPGIEGAAQSDVRDAEATADPNEGDVREAVGQTVPADEAAREQALLRAHLGQERSRRREIQEELEATAAELERTIEKLSAAEKAAPTTTAEVDAAAEVDTAVAAEEDAAAGLAEATKTQAMIEEGHNRQLATLRAQLAQEHWRRRDVEEELKETTAQLQNTEQGVEVSASGLGAADVADTAENTDGIQQALEEANRQVAGLQSELEEERQTRVKAEEQLLSLRAEASTSPFETDRSVDQQQLVELQQALASERQQRDELADRYDALQQEVDASASNAAALGADESEELASLKLQQQRAMAVLQQELAESQQREGELRQTLAATTDGPSSELVEQLVDARTENSDLQTSLDEQRQRNEALSTKLEAATRVAELIFKMQNQQAQ